MEPVENSLELRTTKIVKQLEMHKMIRVLLKLQVRAKNYNFN